MKFSMKYDQTQMVVEINQGQLLGGILPNPQLVLADPVAEIHKALVSPIGKLPLSVIAQGKSRVAIAISDNTRPVQTRIMLPPLLEVLFEAGISPSQIIILVALGIHRPLNETEIKQLVGEDIFHTIRVINHDPNDVIHLGYTLRGTPLDINRHFVEADLRICTGNIDLHFFAGYAGGAKAMMPGLSTREAIANNHRMQLEPLATAGVLVGNPVREDIDESGQRVGIDFILNLVQSEEKEIIAVCAGDALLAHREGCAIIDKMYKIPVTERADVVIASAGGSPKDVNLYQAQKALENASQAVKPGGIILLVAACREGYGEATMARWLEEANQNPEVVLDRLREEFVLGGHKAAAIARVAKMAKIVPVSEMPQSEVYNAFMKPVQSLSEGLALCNLQPEDTIWLMPYASYTLPVGGFLK